MKLLLDTHTFLWLVEGSPNLSATAEEALTDPSNDLFLSAASAWELAIKIGNGKLMLRGSLEDFVLKWTAAYQLAQVPVEVSHAIAVAKLANHHRDPFDRLLIAQAQIEAMTLVSGDAKLSLYGVSVLW